MYLAQSIGGDPTAANTPEKHKQVFEGLRAAGIGVQMHYSPVHLQPYYRALGFAEGQFPEAESYAKSAISLPVYPGLQAIDQEQWSVRLRLSSV